MKEKGNLRVDSQEDAKNYTSLIECKEHPVSFKDVINREPDYNYYIDDKLNQLYRIFSHKMRSLSQVFENFNATKSSYLPNIKKSIKPVISTGMAYLVGELITSRLSRHYHDSDEYEFMYKFVLGAAVLGYSMLHRLTEKRIESEAVLSAAMGAELVAIGYLYSSSFAASRVIFDPVLSENYALIAKLGVSGLVVPGVVSSLARKAQDFAVRRQYKKGAQRSDTASISLGMTPVVNGYLNGNHFFVREMLPLSRLFQLALISDNILHAHSGVQQFRNFPALVADAGPQIVKSVLAQYKKVSKDYAYNTSQQTVLRFVDERPTLTAVDRYRLRNDDLVLCDAKMDTECVPISGKLVALRCDEKGDYIDEADAKKICVNLKAHNGEDLWIEFDLAKFVNDAYKQMELHAIRDGKQAGVLAGAKLNLFGANNIFIRVKDEKERSNDHHYEKTAVINEIITAHKRNNVLYALVLSLVSSGTIGLIRGGDSTFAGRSVHLLFNLFQMIIPFAESFLREMVNKHLMKELNAHLFSSPLETIDALRIVGFCNTLNGYHKDIFPKGVAVITDKTGTLTTSAMDVVGIWTGDEMKSDVTELLKNQNSMLLPSTPKIIDCFKVFASAYTHNKKELESEEYAILQSFKQVFANNEILQVHTLGNQHFRKHLRHSQQEKIIETMHLGLYRKFGGRLTLVADGEQYYLVFCGIPRADRFHDMGLLKAYQAMQPRKRVLSRDWCVAQAQISAEDFAAIKALFHADKRHDIDLYISNRVAILNAFKFVATFIVNNPLKKDAEKFIPRCMKSGIPVFVATGDTAKNAENIANVLCHEFSNTIVTIYSDDVEKCKDYKPTLNSTVICAGVNEKILNLFDRLMQLPINSRPVIIFSEMSTEGKGVLARHLKLKGYFVVANGDGTNDVAMMRSADMVVAHLADDGTYAPGVAQLANINDTQLQKLLRSTHSFYQLFDIHSSQSRFVKLFTRLANSQEKPSIALSLKTTKMGFEMLKAVGVPGVKEMWQQHWCSVAFDLIYMGIAYREMIKTADLPADNKHLGLSNLSLTCLVKAILFAITNACLTYGLTGESANFTSMALTLMFITVELKRVLNAYGGIEGRTADLLASDVDDVVSSPVSLSRLGMFGQRALNQGDIKIEEVNESQLVAAGNASSM